MKTTFKYVLSVCFVILACVMMFTSCDNEDTAQQSGDGEEAHVHEFGEWETTQAPTCVAEGEKTRFCSCGETQTGSIPATGHSFGAWTTTLDATCTKEGTQERACSCGEKETQSIAATGTHNYISNVTTAASCTADGVNTFTCSMCNDSYTEVIPGGHKWVDATCTDAKKCTACNQTEGKALGHDYVSSITKVATCTSDGEITYKCSRCKHSYVEKTTASHNYIDGVCEKCKKFDTYTGCSVVAVKLYYQQYLKNPSSLQLHSIEYYIGSNDKNYYRLEITYSAMNGFGGYNRGYTTLYVHMNGDGTFVYSPYSSSNAATTSYSKTAIKYSSVSYFTNYYQS